MCLDTNISLKPHLSSAIERLAPLTVMFFVFLFAAKTRLVLPPIWSYLIPHPMLTRTAMRLILFHPRMALCWELWAMGLRLPCYLALAYLAHGRSGV